MVRKGPRPKVHDEEYFRSNVEYDTNGGCWLWLATKSSSGYGILWHERRWQKAHRVSYEAVYGPGSADGWVVRHKCDVRSCVNPEHLEIGTQADNSRDAINRGRHARGERHGSAKLTADDVRAIRAEFVQRSRTSGGGALGRRFGVSTDTIGDIIRGKSWTCLA